MVRGSKHQRLVGASRTAHNRQYDTVLGKDRAVDRASKWSICFLVLLVVAGGCGNGASSNSAASLTTATPPTVASALAGAFIAPSGFTQDPDPIAKTGPIDAAKAASEERQGGITVAILNAEGFLGGYQRIFHASDGRRVLLYLYQFERPAGALDYRGRQVESDRSVSGVVTFPVAAIRDAVGLINGSANPPSVIIWLVKNSRAALVGYDYATGDRAGVEQAAIDIATAQFEKL